MKGRGAASAGVLVFLAGCTEPSSAPPSPAPKPPPPTQIAPSSTAPPILPPLPPIEQHPPMCEVEVFGAVKGAGAKDTPTIFLAQGDCLAPDARVLGSGTPAKDGSFRVEVFAPWGADLSFCAAVVPADGKPATRYGKASGAFHAEKLGEVVFQNVVVELKPGAPRAFARPGSAAAPSAGVPRGTP